MFSMEERQDFMIEKGLHQAVVFKLSHGAPYLKVLRSILPKHLGTKGNCLIDLLATRQILLRFGQYEDYVLALSRSFVDGKYDKLIEVFQEIVYDNLPLYCNDCKHQGHDEDSCQKIMDSRHKLMDTSNVEDAETSGQHILQVETKNATKNWTLVQVKLTENNNDLIQKSRSHHLLLNSKLSPEASVFVPKCVIAKKNESRVLVSNTIDLGEDSLDENEEDNMLDFGEDSLDEDEEYMLDMCFDRYLPSPINSLWILVPWRKYTFYKLNLK
ncbi:hypothetical protein R3W88_020177 [Solanum pinnatisectum]|uniref:DUF4283 domain-containing protein n=1 Tax=Solanum pinnatisectum TaxID=50273 RepID=A0AAV9KNN4_9SOLN|nr:hypothetical protein R3W88_020177 [Solanum pinnatisectum]